MRDTLCLLALAVVVVSVGAGCGESDTGTGFADAVDKANAAKALSSLQTALVTVSLAEADYGGGTGTNLVTALQAKDPTSRYTTTPPAEPGVVQVVGGGGAPVMLVAISDPGSEDSPAQYVGAWQGNGSTMYYAGAAAPAYTTDVPTGAGWGSTLPQ